jgi:hypothetical protein
MSRGVERPDGFSKAKAITAARGVKWGGSIDGTVDGYITTDQRGRSMEEDEIFGGSGKAIPSKNSATKYPIPAEEKEAAVVRSIKRKLREYQKGKMVVYYSSVDKVKALAAVRAITTTWRAEKAGWKDL